MKKLRFAVPIYDIDVVLLQVEDKEDEEAVIEEMAQYNITDEIEEEVRNAISNDHSDGASTFWNGGLHVSVIVFYRMESMKRKRVCYSHEKRHLEDRILKFCDIDDMEAAAYLAGFLSEYFDDLLLK